MNEVGSNRRKRDAMSEWWTWIRAVVIVCALLLAMTSCENLQLPHTYEGGPCADTVDTTNVDAYLFTMPRTDVVVPLGSQQQFWPLVDGLSCGAVYYRLNRSLGRVDAMGLYSAPDVLDGDADSVLLIIQSAAKRSLLDTILIHVRKPVDTCNVSNVSFSQTVLPLIQENCTGCHSSQSYTKSGGGVLLESYDDIRRSALEGRLLATTDYSSPYKMPKNSLRLSKCSIDALRTWVLKGAPND